MGKTLNAICWTLVAALLYFICLTIVQDEKPVMACPVDQCDAVATESMD